MNRLPRLTRFSAGATGLSATVLGAALIACPVWFAPQAAAALLPCPANEGWRLERAIELPRRTPAGARIGGFSAVHYDPSDDSLLLVSDLPQGSALRWAGLRSKGMPVLQEVIALRNGSSASLPAALDAEGLVVLGSQWWVASEGRRSLERPAQLLRFSATSGQRLKALDLPADWQPGEGRGLASNGGPESLLLLGGDGRSEPAALLLAAERPLLQDPPRQVRLLRWQWAPGADPALADPLPIPQGALQLPWGDGWGLTDLLPLESGQLLGLLRRFEPPDRWQIRLALYPLPPIGSRAAHAPQIWWDLLAAGLPPDNWEGLSTGPLLPDGRPTLLLVSDDNLNPWQSNRLALLTAKRHGSCPDRLKPERLKPERLKREND